MDDDCVKSDDDAHHVETVWKPMSFDIFNSRSLQEVNDTGPNHLAFSALQIESLSRSEGRLQSSLKLPELETFTYSPIENLDVAKDALSSPCNPPVCAGLQDSNNDDGGLWSSADILHSKKQDGQLLTWNQFERAESLLRKPVHEPALLYVSESGPAVFDALLHKIFAHDETKRHLTGPIVRTDVFLRSLTEVGVGRSSIIFPYDRQSRSFVQAVDGGKMSGYSGLTIQSLVAEQLQCGNSIIHLKERTSRILNDAESTPEVTALASTVISILQANESYINGQALGVKTLTQVQGVFHPARKLIRSIDALFDVAASSSAVEAIPSHVLTQLQMTQECDNSLASILMGVFERVSAPLLSSLAEWIGFQLPRVISIAGDALLSDLPPKDGSETISSNENLLFDQLSSIVGASDANLVREAAASLNFLRQHASDDPMSQPHLLSIDVPGFSWARTPDQVEDIADRARSYEVEMRRKMSEVKVGTSASRQRDFKSTLVSKLDEFCSDLADDRRLWDSIRLLDESPSCKMHDSKDSIMEATTDYLRQARVQQKNATVPVESLIALSLRPLLQVQHDLLAEAAIHSLLHSHSLQTHLKIYRDFHLHGSGVFTSSLANVLFSPELQSAERVKGSLRSGHGMGLRIGSGDRQDWPPATSEIQLALLGVINESWRESKSTTGAGSSARPAQPRSMSTASSSRDVPGGLSFAIHNLSDAEIDRVLDADSIYALDFLRLSHNPPPALQSLFTNEIVEKYDRVFKLLLRFQRVRFVLDLLYHKYVACSNIEIGAYEAIIYRFISQARHFTVMLYSHFELFGISHPWQIFQSQIHALEQIIGDNTTDRERKPALPSLSVLADGHIATINAITSSLFLRKRHAPIASSIETVLGDILSLANNLRDARLSSIPSTYAEFRAHVQAFLQACCDLAAKTATKSGLDQEEVLDAGPASARALIDMLDWR